MAGRTRRRTKKKVARKASEAREGYVSEHFSIREIGRSSTAVREGIDNTPDEGVIRRAKLLADNVLEPVREQFATPFSPGSWYRCEALEKLICRSGFGRWCAKQGRAKDQEAWDEYFLLKSHPRGEAADIEIPGVDNAELFEWIRDNCEYDQLIREGYREGDPQSGWIHVSYRETGNRKEAFDIANP